MGGMVGGGNSLHAGKMAKRLDGLGEEESRARSVVAGVTLLPWMSTPARSR